MPKPDYYVDDASDSDPDGESYPIYRNLIGGGNVTFRVSCGKWYVNSSLHDPDRKIWVMSDQQLRMSTNDIRESDFTIWYRRVFCTDHVEITSSAWEIRNKKQDRARRRRARYESQERRRKASLERARREKERLETLRKEEEKRKKEQAEKVKRQKKFVLKQKKQLEEALKALQDAKDRTAAAESGIGNLETALKNPRADLEELERRVKSSREALEKAEASLEQDKSCLQAMEALEAGRDQEIASQKEAIEAYKTELQTLETRITGQKNLLNKLEKEVHIRKEEGFFEKMWRWGPGEIVNAIKDTASRAWQSVKNGVASAAEGVKDVASSVWQGTKYVAKKIWQGTKYVAKKTWQGTKYVTKKTWQGTKYVAKKTWGFIKENPRTVVAAGVVVVACILRFTRTTRQPEDTTERPKENRTPENKPPPDSQHAPGENVQSTLNTLSNTPGENTQSTPNPSPSMPDRPTRKEKERGLFEQYRRQRDDEGTLRRRVTSLVEQRFVTAQTGLTRPMPPADPDPGFTQTAMQYGQDKLQLMLQKIKRVKNSFGQEQPSTTLTNTQRTEPLNRLERSTSLKCRKKRVEISPRTMNVMLDQQRRAQKKLIERYEPNSDPARTSPQTLLHTSRETVAEIKSKDKDDSMKPMCSEGVRLAFKKLTGRSISPTHKLEANSICRRMRDSPDWKQVSQQEAQNLANQGHLIVAGQLVPGGPGHVVMVVPGEETYSSKWKMNVPVGMDVGVGRYECLKISFSFKAKDKHKVKFYLYKGELRQNLE